MSYRLNEGDVVATSSYNGRFYTTSTEPKAVERQPEELLAWALLKLAVDETKILARYGLFTRDGELRPWPRRKTNRDGYVRWEPIIIANMKDPLDHARLREFWLDPTQGQHWCDLIGCRLPAKDIWNGILKHHAK